MRRALLIHNPRAGRWRSRKLLPRIIESLRRGGIAAQPAATTGPGDATTRARTAARSGVWDLVLAFGGDGTVRETAAGLLDSPLPLGILPGGTTNVLARACGLPPSAAAAAEALGRARSRPFDVGLCAGEPFLMSAACGVDARILARAAPRAKRRLGRAAVAAAGLAAIWRYPYPELTAHTPAGVVTGFLMAACNVPLYAGSFVLAPAARPDDGLLDLVILERRGPRAYLAFLARVALGRHLRHPSTRSLQVPELTVTSPAELEVQLDGEVRRLRAPLRLTVSPRRLELLCLSGTSL